MAKINRLPVDLANQIAAGEVVERPASVVKELVENALDAGARRIDVEIEGGGRRLVRVVDDGWGLLPDEARLALRRHATSKLSTADDLWALSTFGFRGEALPSIAAVSRLTLLSRPREAPDGGGPGFRLVVEAGVETDAREAGVPAGTQVEVRDLFFNTPARAKFLKSESTEEANIYEAVLRLGIAHPDVHLRLRVKGAVRLDLPPHRDLAERVRAALARRGAGALHEAMGEEGGHGVRAFLADPDAASTTARNTYLFVGGRAVRDRALLHAVAQAYGPLLEKGRYPLAALFLEVPGGELDVNVHPQKLEVRFARPQEVYAAVRHVLGAALARAPWLESAGAAASRGQPLRAFTLPPGRGERAVGGAGSWTQVASTQAALPLRARDAAPDGAAAGDGRGGAPPAGVARATDGADRSLGVVDAGTPFFAGLNYIGQLHRTYLVCESQGAFAELILVDQHAAHERIAYGRLVAAHGRREVRRQRLLFPLPIEVDEAAAAVVEGAGQATLDALGFEVERTGARAVRVRAVPEMLKDADPKPLLRDVLAQLAEGQPTAETLEGIDHVLATMACHSVVRAGDVLGRSEAVGLLAQLDGVDLRSHCPHGRPVLLRLPLGEIERRFGRV